MRPRRALLLAPSTRTDWAGHGIYTLCAGLHLDPRFGRGGLVNPDPATRARRYCRVFGDFSRDADTVFVYAASRAEAERAHAVVEAELRAHGVEARTSGIEHWLDEEDRWDDEPPGETWEEEELERGFAPWEVRVECASRQEAGQLAEQLEAEGYKPERRFHYLIVGTASREDADALATRLHGEVEPGGELVYEVEPRNPFAIFGGMGV